MKRLLLLLASVGLLPIASLLASPVTLSNNLGTVTEYTEIARGDNWLTASFGTDQSAYALSSVTLLLLTDSPGVMSLFLYANRTGMTPGTPLGMLTSSGIDPSSTEPGLAVFAGNGLMLTPNTTYWLVLKANGTAGYEWAFTKSNTGIGPGFQHTWGISTDAGANWSTSDLEPFQMSVEANALTSPVPEPTNLGISVGFMTLAALTLLHRLNRKTKAGRAA